MQQHHLIKHIAVQILNFKLAFDEDKEKIKKILLDQIEKDQKIKDKCTKYALNNDYENLHNLIDKMVNGSEFQTIIVIDESDPSVEKNLLNNFKFETSILNLRKYESSDDNKIYQFDTFDEETGTDSYTENNDDQEIIDKSKFDTIVVPARKDGFERVFIGDLKFNHSWFGWVGNFLNLPLGSGEFLFSKLYTVSSMNKIFNFYRFSSIRVCGGVIF